MRGDGTVYLRGKTWWIKFHRDGKPVSMSCAGLTEAQARMKLKRELRKTDEEFVEPKIQRVTIGELMVDVLADYDARGAAGARYDATIRWEKHLKAVFADVKAHKFGTDHQNTYRARRAAAGAANATINREMQLIRRAFHLGFQHEPPKVKRIPKFVLPREDNARQGFVTATQIEALKRAAERVAPPAYYILIELAHKLGWRKGELLNLHVSNINLLGGGPFGSIRLEAHETKTKKPREVALNKTLRAYLAPLVAGKQPTDRLLPTRTLDVDVWHRIVEEADLPGLHFHDLRRSSARSKRSAGVSESVIMAMQGWETAGMFRRYAIVSADDKVDALQKQEEFEKQQAVN